MSAARKESTRENVKVVCRVRPQNEKEIQSGGNVCVRLSDVSIEVNLDDGQHAFTFDRVFGPDSTQDQVFTYCAVPLIKDVLSGYNATIFAYGQTSSGKTFIMEGPNIRDAQLKGIIPRTVEALFAGVSEADENIEFCFKVSYVEIYCEKVRDLLDNHRVKTNLMIREDVNRGIYIAGVTEEYVTSEEELLSIMNAGALNRAVAATGMNEGSSRSHSVFSITVTQRDISNASTKSGKLVLVDLAGSETVRKTNASGQQLEEAKMINKSLSALGLVINALTDEKASHIPYRDSKLTRILQDSLGGNSKTALIVACSPSSYNGTETVSTLRFGMRAKSIQNKVTVNLTRSVEELEDLLSKSERVIDAQQARIISLTAQLEELQDNKSPETDIQRRISRSNSRLEQEAGLIEKLQETIKALQLELDEEREETKRVLQENEKLSELLNEKDGVLIEAGELMQDAQALYENAKSRCEQLVREKADLSGELEGMRVTMNDEVSKVKYEMQEMEVTLETMRADNVRLRQEIAQMSGDDVESEAGSRKSKPEKSVRRENMSEVTSDDVSVGSHKRGISPSRSTREEEIVSRANPRSIDLTGRHESLVELQKQLQEVLTSHRISGMAHEDVLQWYREHTAQDEKWFKIADEKCIAYERTFTEMSKRIKDLESHRSRLEKDLQNRAEKVIQQQLDLDNLSRNPSAPGATDFLAERDQTQMRCLQQRLEQLVAVHRQLLRKFASLELENGELRKKLVLRDERIKQLELNAKGLTANLRQQAERHVGELTNLREQIQEMKTEFQQRMENKASEGAHLHRHEGPRVIRGGNPSGAVENGPRLMRGGGSKKGPSSPETPSTKNSLTSGLFARFLGK